MTQNPMKKLWLFNIAVGIGAFLISLILEYNILASITQRPYSAFILTLVLESAKVMTVVFNRFIEERRGTSVPDSVANLSLFFKAGLITLSLICSVALISKGLDSPNLENLKNQDEKRIQSSFNEKTEFLKSQRRLRLEQMTSEIKEKYEKRHSELDSYYLPKISETERLRAEEFQNVGRGGLRRGPVWNEYNRQLESLNRDYKREKERLRSAENTELEKHIGKIEEQFQRKIEDSMDAKSTALSNIDSSTYESDERVKDPIVAAFLKTMDEGLNLEIEYLTFAIFISVLISLLLEITIYLTFNYVVMFYNSILVGQPDEISPMAIHEPELETGTFGTPINGGTPVAGEVEPDDYEFFQNLQDQFNEPLNGDDQFDSPCSQRGGEV